MKKISKIAMVILATFCAFQSVRAASGVEIIKYDALGRLKTVTYPDGRVLSYQYDAVGNRTTVTPSLPSVFTDSPTMTPGVYNCGPNNCPYALGGYVRTSGLPSIGSLSTVSLSGGKSVANFYDRHAGGYGYQFSYAEFSVSGFSSDPGVAWLTSATANGQTMNSGASSYSYSAGTATWRWTTPFGFLNGGTSARSVSIVHK